MYNARAMKPQRKLSEKLVRLVVLLLGLFILAHGIAFTILANLGTDAITSPALVAHLVLGEIDGGTGYSFCTVGRMLICVHILLVLMQIALLRSKYKPIQLLQVVMGLILGNMLDFYLSYTSLLPLPNYAAVLGYTLLGCVICAVSTGYIIGWFFKVCPLWDKVFAALGATSGNSSDLA